MEQIDTVLVGGGQASATVAARLRASGHPGSIAIFSEEPHPPYQRPPLSKKFLLGTWPSERLFLHSIPYWEESRIDLHLSEMVLAIDTARKEIETDQGRFGWKNLVLATGARPRPRPAGFALRENVFDLRTIADVDALRPHFQNGRHLVVVGGGYVGLETAAVAVQAGLVVSVIEYAPRILSRVACAETAAELHRLHADRNVQILEGRTVVETEGEARLDAVRLDDGTRIELDLAIVGIGVNPRVDLALDAGIVCENGIRVDAFGRTSKPGIWAAGDCTNFDLNGAPTRLESVQNAIDQSEVVADDIMGRSRPYRPTPWFWSDQFDMKLQIAGLNRGFDELVTHVSDRGKSFWYLRQNKLIAVDAVNDARAYMAGKRLLETGRTLTASRIKVTDFDPMRLMKEMN